MLFAPLQTVSTDIQPVAYRTSMILVEDGGKHIMAQVEYLQTATYIQTITYNDNQINYSYNISLVNFSDNLILNSSSAPLLRIGDSIPTSGSVTVEKIERIVAIDNTTGLTGNRTIAGHECAKLVVCIWR